MVSKALKKWHLLLALNGKVEGEGQSQGEKALTWNVCHVPGIETQDKNFLPISSVKWAWKISMELLK